MPSMSMVDWRDWIRPRKSIVTSDPLRTRAAVFRSILEVSDRMRCSVADGRHVAARLPDDGVNMVYGLSPDSEFYVHTRAGQTVDAQFLLYNSVVVLDANDSTAQNARIYDDAGTLIPDANPNGYLIVPLDYTIASALALAQSITDVGAAAGDIPDKYADELKALAAMFKQGGIGDLQRTYNGLTWNGANNPNGEAFVGAFTDAASFNLGLVTQQSDLSLLAAQFGGGAYRAYKNIPDFSNFNTFSNTIGNIAKVLSDAVYFGNPVGVFNSINQGFAFGEHLVPENPGSRFLKLAAAGDGNRLEIIAAIQTAVATDVQYLGADGSDLGDIDFLMQNPTGYTPDNLSNLGSVEISSAGAIIAVSYTHLTLPTN